MAVQNDAQLVIRQTVRVPSPGTFDLASTVFSHGWVKLDPWVWDGLRLARVERFGMCRGRLSIRQTGTREISAEWPGNAGIPETKITRRIQRRLSWDWDAEEFCPIAGVLDPDLAALVGSGRGRFLRGSCFYEDFVKTVCPINTTWGQTFPLSDDASFTTGAFYPVDGGYSAQ